MKSARILVLAAAVPLLISGCVAKGTNANSSFPSDTVTIVVPYAPGGPTDLSARALAKGMSDDLGAPVVVVNRAGAGGVVGASEAASAKPDGHTLIYTPAGVFMQTEIRETSYNFGSFTPVRGIMEQPGLIAVRADSPWQTMADLEEVAKPLTYGVSGAGNLNHLDQAVVYDHLGIDATGVPFEGGAPATGALLGGQVDVLMNEPNTLMPHVDSGKLRVLAAVTPDGERLDYLPDVPVARELGWPDERLFTTVWGIAAPAGTSAEVMQRLRRSVEVAMDQPEFRKVLEANYMPVVEGDTVDDWYSDAEREAERAAALIDRYRLLEIGS